MGKEVRPQFFTMNINSLLNIFIYLLLLLLLLLYAEMNNKIILVQDISEGYLIRLPYPIDQDNNNL